MKFLQKISSLLLFFLATHFAFAQNTSGTTPGESVSVFYGKKFFSRSYFDQLTQLDPFEWNRPLNIIGFGGAGNFLAGRNVSGWGHLAFLFVLPLHITADSAKAVRISGFTFSFAPLGFALFKNSDHFKIIMDAGLNAGRLKLRDENKLLKKNPALAPFVSLCPKLRIGKITMLLIVMYDYDLSKSSWRRMLFRSSNNFSPSPFSQSGLTTLIGLNYQLSYVQSSGN